jgi:tight adherence protein B
VTTPVLGLVTVLVVAALLVRPGRGDGSGVAALVDTGASGAPGGAPVDAGWSGLWSQDPVVLWRRWRLRRRPADVETAVLSLLDATAPGLRAGLPAATCLRLTLGGHAWAGHGAGSEGVRGPGGAPGDRDAGPGGPAFGPLGTFGPDLLEAADRGAALSPAWVALADVTRSPTVGFVASAWRLSEVTGAPLADAVDRAAEGLRAGRSRRRRVDIAVAGPRATVQVLTLLPLTGPFFGWICGVPPLELYLGNAISSLSLLLGLVLLLAGRAWCRRLVAKAVAP